MKKTWLKVISIQLSIIIGILIPLAIKVLSM